MNVERIKESLHDILWAYAFSRVAGDNTNPEAKDEINKWVDETAEKIAMCHLPIILFNEFGDMDKFRSTLHQLMWLRCGMIDGALSRINQATDIERSLLMTLIARLVEEVTEAFCNGMKGSLVQ